MAKNSNKKTKKRKGRSGGAAGVLDSAWRDVAGGIIGNVLGQMLADGMEHYLSGGQKKKNVKRLRKMILKATSLRKS